MMVYKDDATVLVPGKTDTMLDGAASHIPC